MANNNALTPKNNNTPATPDIFEQLNQFEEFKQEVVTGLESIDASDLKLPKIKLIQPTSLEATKGQCPAGYFYNTITKEAFKEFECILLALRKTRVRWKRPFKRGEEPLCRSFDGIIGINGQNCDKCQYARWDILQEGQTKPECNLSYVWLGIDKNGMPFRIIMAGSNVSITKDFINVIAPRRLPPFVYKVVLSSEQKENDSGVFYVVKYNIVGVINKEDFKKLEDMSKSYAAMFSQIVRTEKFDDVADEISADNDTAGSLF